MEKIVVGMIGVAFKILLRCWTRDNKSLNSCLEDIIDFAETYGLTYLDAKKFNRTMEDFIDAIAEDFIKEFKFQLGNEQRKDAILCQIQADIQKINMDECELIMQIHSPSDLQVLIMAQSEQERMLWSESEVGIYSNCVKYISKMGMDFISKLPSFSTNALKVIIQRQEEYFKELQKIVLDIHSMTSLLKSSEIEYREYERIYREKVIEKYGKIELIGSKIQDRHIRRYDITSAYVKLNCINNEFMTESDLSRIFETGNVVWIKGEAGAGKTTFLQWIAICSAKGEYGEIRNIENTLPIVIELRNIDWPLNLQNIINIITLSEGVYCPEGWIYELLKRQEAILLFDGLDEIAKKNRDAIYDYIEYMVAKYPQIKVLLTSRNSVKDSINCLQSYYEILPMKMEHINNFIIYWHNSVLRQDAIAEDEEIEKLQYNLAQRIGSSRSLKELARYPLLCAMLCALNYVNNEQLPQNKAQLYEQCCEMLMDARDSQRNINVDIYENVPQLDYIAKRRILEEIAFRMLNGGVLSEKRENVEYFLCQFFRDTKIIMNKESTYSVNNILDFLIERSGIIRESKEGVIDFIHKTFMEFLAVKAICRNCEWDVLVREACNVEWKETIVMCFREMGNNSAEYILRRLQDKGNERNDDRYYLMASLCASNAQFFYAPIKDEIDKKVKEMIPPSDEKIDAISELGPYLLAFLKDTDDYLYQEKYNCLRVLSKLKTKEAIPVILSYIKPDVYVYIYQFAAELLFQYDTEELDEYNAKEYLINILINSICEDSLFTCEAILYILNEVTLSKQKSRYLETTTRVVILAQDCLPREGYKTDIGKYFGNCETLEIIGNFNSLNFLKGFHNIKNLVIKSEIRLSVLTYELAKMKNMDSVISICLDTNQWEIYLFDRLMENMKNLEEIEIFLRSTRLRLNSDTFEGFCKLKKIIFNVYETIAIELKNEWKKMVLKNECRETIINIID